ncbi:hypothetical protein DL98DRAFT_514492 [Cadophora sp. DSE1049]|nr:hypothetical protein DL98DRAFT_514492 [Cadophora sp. DSE1049]
MLPPRQKTVSPPRRVKTSEVEKNNTVQVTTSPGALLREPLPTIPSTVTTEETGPQPLRQPSTQDLREKTLSPLRRNPVVVESLAEAEVVPVGIATKDVEPVIPVMMEEAKRSTYQQNTPHHSLVLGEKDLFFAAGGGEGVEETESDDRQYRGRSMIRTSDIIEARLSMNSQIQEDWKSLQALEARLSSVVQKSQPIISSSAPNNENNKMDIDIGKSPLRRNPVDISSIPRISMHRRTKTLPAPRQHIHRANVTKRRSRSLSPIRLVNKFLQLDRSPILPLKSPLRLNPLDTITTKRRSRSLSPPRPPILSLQPIPRSISRDDSPLRRNPTRGHSPMVSFGVDSKPSNPSTRVPKVASNGLFAQSLSKFQNLASQNPQDAMMASTEVTQRAIAGIFIPGSLREEAVRTVSKSRERRGD